MKKNKLAFTLIEMIVGVFITIILMISVGIFVSSGIKNITIQKQILDKSNDIGNLIQDLNTVFGKNYNIITNSSTSILLRTNYILGTPAYYYIGEKTLTGYCLNDPNIENKYLEFKVFNPVFLTGTVYSGSYIKNEVYSGGQVIAGNGVFGDLHADSQSGTLTYLNNPLGLAYSGNKVYISDSGNNRILYVSGGLIYKIFDIDDGIFNPTGILCHLSKLYILNSGKNQLLVMDSSSSAPKPINLVITPENNITIDKIDIEVLPNFTLIGTYNTGSYDFSGTITKNTGDTVSGSANKLTYTFSGSVDLIGGNNYKINIPSFSGILSGYGNYYLKVSFSSGSNPVYEKYFSYLTNGDNDLTTLNDNTLKILTGSLNKNFSQIRGSGANIILYNYIDGEYLELSSTGNFVSSGNLTPFNLNDFDYIDKSNNLMIKDLKIAINGNLLTLKIDYYKSFSCFNEKDSILKTILIKKIIPN